MRPIFSTLISIMIGVPGMMAAAAEPLEGTFLATAACPAVQSLRNGTNPGNVRVRPNESYPALSLNKPDGDYLQIRVDGAQPMERWVKRDCGILAGRSEVRASSSVTPTANGQYVLAFSWQPSFCETKPGKQECRTQTSGRFDADHLTLHGLWPQPESNAYCGVPARDQDNDRKSRWNELPEPALSPNTRRRLDQAMPGTISQLQRHEYTKHGTCYQGTPDAYFRAALALLDQINASRLRQLLAANVGKTVSTADIKDAFEQSFGPGSGAALGIRCIGDIDSRRILVSEFQLALKGVVTDRSKLRDVLDTSTRATSTCSSGIVDGVGLD